MITIPPRNFSRPPPGNGAFIIRNSWGTGWGDNGYFYLSYYDGQIGKNNCQFFNAEAPTNYTRNYGYDPLGWVNDAGYNTVYSIWGANVFTCAGDEQLSAVGFYANNTNMSYEIRIYVNPAAGSPVNGGNPVATQTGSLTLAGFYTIPLTTPVALTQGQKFSVAIKYTTPGYGYPLSLEYATDGYSSAATAAAGQSYFGPDGTDWTDLTSYDPTANCCIKAFTSTETTSFQPDLLIRTGAEVNYIGNNIYNTTGTLQTKSQNANAGQTVTYYCRVQNDGDAADSFIITGPSGGSGWAVGYVNNATGGVITGAVTGAGWNTGILAPGQYVVVVIRVVPTCTAAAGSSRTVSLRAVSMGEDSRVDVVKAITIAATTCLPDQMIRTSAEGSYLGDNVYNASGVGQTKTQNVAAGQTAAYYCRVQNDGNIAESYTITAPAGGSGWAVGYVNNATGANITAAVTGTGWNTGIIAPGQYIVVLLRVVPTASVPGGGTKEVGLQARSQSDASRIDVVKAITGVTAKYQPDLLIRTSAETSYTGDNVYNATGAGQTKAQSVVAGQTATYYCRIQNDGNITESFTVTGLPGGSGWAVGYVNYATNGSITAAVTGAGWTTGAIAPGQNVVVVIRVVPSSAAPAGTSKEVWLQATSKQNAARLDVVKVVTTRL